MSEKENCKEIPFYMVFVDGGNTPTFKHFNPEDAEKEAKGLPKAQEKGLCALHDKVV